jgi:hypothetical protein
MSMFPRIGKGVAFPDRVIYIVKRWLKQSAKKEYIEKNFHCYEKNYVWSHISHEMLFLKMG